LLERISVSTFYLKISFSQIYLIFAAG